MVEMPFFYVSVSKEKYMLFINKTKVYAFVGPSGTGKSYRAQMVANEKNIKYIIAY